MTDLGWETVSEQIAYSCEGFDIVNERVRLPDGTEAEFDYLTEGASAVVLPFTTDGEVVVIDEWRHAVKRRNRGLPAGSLEAGEDREQGARRELREETGYEAGKMSYLGGFEPANGFSDAYFHYFVARDCEPAGEQSLDVDETIEVTTTAFGDLLDAVRSGDLEDGRTATAILYYALFERDES
ncbi:NUDIX domain-containing protein [Halovenus sp. WSH3]|uniref:NUDIX domain-containing protein n=1 Tax=Halovenus carboxidivorans TaxID=2692199 RepID=A0A6B0TAC7_9EURY|nr:NUDIX hydrolase [Halovenus carboxidivorans]MXR50139.1 NUDIX domain-containing protein [Halovenus carboxidivorans]